MEILEKDKEALTPLITKALADQPLIQAESVMLQGRQRVRINDCLVAVGSNLLQNVEEAFKLIVEDGFILSRENLSKNIDQKFIQILLVHETPKETFVLFRKPHQLNTPAVVSLDNPDWIKKLQNLMKRDKEILIVSQNNSISGITGLVNCIRKEPGGELCKCLFIQDETAPIFDIELEFYRKQLNKRLVFNIYKNGQWGTYRYLRLEPKLVSEQQHAYVEVLSKGAISSMRWMEGPLSTYEQCVSVHYTALNFRDIMTVSGRIKHDTSNKFDERDFLQGLEFSGRNYE